MIFALELASFVLLIVWIMLLARIALSWIFAFARDWHPTGVSALLVESVYSVTDPMIKPIRKIIPPVSIGSMRFDVAFLIVFFGVYMLRNLLLVMSASIS